jgi:hypothetical protein
VGTSENQYSKGVPATAVAYRHALFYLSDATMSPNQSIITIILLLAYKWHKVVIAPAVLI